ncbi:MAG: allophanate hydrolase, partial [Sheuella sp.]|nr:allophanate hydrolase [Sheuella sp.]
SSGSASVVARGLVSFSLGTDTAGSGRIPAGFNNIVGMKPTPGLVSIEGVLPACKTLDCVSVFAGTSADAAIVLSVMQSSPAERASEPQFHPSHPAESYFPAKLRIGIPLVPEFLGNLEYKNAFIQAISSARSMGGIIRQIDFSALNRVASLLYSGPWVAERYVTIEHLLNTRPETLDPSVSKVVSMAEQFSAADAFKALYELKEHALRAQEIWSECDVLLVPTAPTHPTLKEVAADPILRNSELGLYTNFVNLLEMSAIAVPAGLTDSGMPFGVTFIAPGGYDHALLSLGERWQSIHKLAPGAPQTHTSSHAHYLRIAVVGAHLQGMPLHQQLVDRQCRLIERTKTSSSYRLYALANTSPPKPGLVRSMENGHQIELEIYEMPSEHVGSFLELIAAPLGLGSVELADGTWVKGFICEPWAIAQAQDISQLGGWRAYIESNVNT